MQIEVNLFEDDFIEDITIYTYMGFTGLLWESMKSEENTKQSGQCSNIQRA